MKDLLSEEMKNKIISLINDFCSSFFSSSFPSEADDKSEEIKSCTPNILLYHSFEKEHFVGCQYLGDLKSKIFDVHEDFELENIDFQPITQSSKGWNCVVAVYLSNKKTFFVYFDIIEESILTNSGDVNDILDHIIENDFIDPNINPSKFRFSGIRIVNELENSSYLQSEIDIYNDKKVASFSDVKSFISKEKNLVGFAKCKLEENYPILHVDHNLVKLLKYDSIEEIVAVGNLFSLFHPADILHKTEHINHKILNNGEKLSFDLRLKSKDNSYMWVSILGHVINDEKHQKSIHLYFLDINTRLTEVEKFFNFIQKSISGFALFKLDNSDQVYPLYYSPTLDNCLKLGVPNIKPLKDNIPYAQLLENILTENEATYFYGLLYKCLHTSKQFAYDLKVIESDKQIKWINACGQTYIKNNNNAFLYVTFTDVTSYKAQANKLQSMYDKANGSLLTCSYHFNELNILECSSSFYQQLGYNQNEISEIYNNNFLLMLADNDRKKVLEFLETTSKNNDELSFEVEISSKNGDKLIYLFIGNRELQADLTTLDILLINITDSYTAKTMLEKANDQVKQLYHNIPGAILRCAYSPELEVDFANEGFFRLIGYTAREFQKKFGGKLINLICKTNVDFVRKHLSSFDTENKLSLQFKVTTKSSDVLWLDMHSRLITDENGTSYLYATCTDVSLRYEIHNMLKVTKEKMGIAILNAGLLCWDYYPLENKAVLFANNIKNFHETVYHNFPECVVDMGYINESTVEAYFSVHAKIKSGAEYAEAEILSSFGNNDGKESWRRLRYVKVLNEDPSIPCYVGTSENIDSYKEVEKKLNLTIAQTGIDIWTYNIKTKTIIQDNNSRTVGLTDNIIENVPESIIERNIIHPKDVDKYRKMYEKVHNGDDIVTEELRVKNTFTDKYEWIKVHYNVTKDKTGKPNFAFASSYDITEQKNAENSYEESVQLWNRGMSDFVVSGIANLTQNDMFYLKFKEDFEQDIIHTAEEFFFEIEDRIKDINYKEEFKNNISVAKLLELFKNGVYNYSFETKILSKSNESLWICFDIKMLKQPSSEDIMCFLSLNDITQTKISQFFTSEFVENQFDFIFYINYEADTYKLFTAEHINAAFKAMPKFTGSYSCDSKVMLENTVVEEDLERILNERNLDTILKRCQLEGHYDVYFKVFWGGVLKYKQIRVFLFDDISKSVCFGCVDVTDIFLEEQKRVENLKQALDIAKQASEAKSTFLASMSHDIRTPMNAIIGMTNLAIEDIDNKEQIKESLNVIKSSSEHLLSLLNDILEMSRLESKKVVFNRDSFSIYDECLQVYNFFKGITIQKRQTINFINNNLVHENVISDVTRFNRVLTNLLGNAVKFTPEEGTISLILEEIGMDTENVARYCISIEDTGIGIAEENLEFIFDAFHREEKSVKNIEGTGLGLAIVKALVEYQNGDIKVESELGKGSKFIIELPMFIDTAKNKKNKEKAKQLNMQDINLNNTHILLVEDHPINVLVATKILEKMGAKITVAVNGQEGVDVFVNNPPKTFDFIFMDLQMPVLNGLDATVTIRQSKHEEASSIPIIAMTANAYAEDVRKSKLAGMNYHIAKPITVENIYTCLNKLNLLNKS